MSLLSSNSYTWQPRKGGLVQVVSHPSGSKTETALQAALETTKKEAAYFLWVADEGVLYPEALHHSWQLPLSHLLLVKVCNAPEVWRTGLEAIQTGLFGSVFLRASRPCQAAQLRKLQLTAEKNRCEVFLLVATELPHWTLKKTLLAGQNAHSVLPQPTASYRSSGKLFHSHAESILK